jgi:hypothetical protein
MMKDMTERSRRRVAGKEADAFWARSKGFLERRDTGKMRDGLEEIMALAVNLSYRLWTQRSHLIRESRKILLQPYDRKNRAWTASGLHTADLDDDEKCMDGKPVLLVFHPAVILQGDSEGSDYNVRRILKKGVVWMG